MMAGLGTAKAHLIHDITISCTVFGFTVYIYVWYFQAYLLGYGFDWRDHNASCLTPGPNNIALVQIQNDICFNDGQYWNNSCEMWLYLREQTGQWLLLLSHMCHNRKLSSLGHFHWMWYGRECVQWDIFIECCSMIHYMLIQYNAAISLV